MGRPKKIHDEVVKVKKSVGRPKTVKPIEAITTGYMDVLPVEYVLKPIKIKYGNYVNCIMELFIGHGLKDFLKEEMRLLSMTYVEFYTNKYISEMIYSEIQMFYDGRIDIDVLKSDIHTLCQKYKVLNGH